MTDSSLRYVGLDVHKRVVEACLVDPAGQVVHRQRFALNRRTLELFAAKILRPGDQVALEATTNCWAVADALRPHVARVVVSNPMATKAIAQAKVKTDKVDAYVLGQLLRCDFLPEVWAPDEATRRLRELTGRRSALVGQRTALRNRIHAALAVRLIEAPARLFTGEGLTWLEGLELDAQGRQLVDSDLRQIQLFDQELAQLEQELARRGYESEAVKLLMTLPGVDVTTAEALLAAWGDFRRLAKKKNRNVAVVASARKLATIAWLMLTSNEPYRYSIPRTTERKLAQLRVKATGERRKGGSAKGTKSTAKLPGGSRTVKPLAEVFAREGLPPARPLTAGEQRLVERTECGEFVGRIAQPQVVPRRAGTSTAGNAHRPRPAAAKPA